MQNLRLVLIIIGILIVVSLLVHGFWLNRKERSSLFKTSLLDEVKGEKTTELNAEIPLDQLSEGVGKVMVVSRQDVDNIEQYSIKKRYSHSIKHSHPKQGDLFTKESNRLSSASSTAAKRPVTQLHDTPRASSLNTATAQSIHDSATPHTYSNLAFTEETSSNANVTIPQTLEPESPQDSVPVQSNPQIISLHVGALAGQLIAGKQLLKSFADAGLEFGELNIFHRYFEPLNLANPSQRVVLFSVANMINPGEFQLEKMDEFSTPGVTLFMLVPGAGDSQQSFKIMLQTAQRIADEVGGLVLDQERHILSPQKITEYRQTIKGALESHRS